MLSVTNLGRLRAVLTTLSIALQIWAPVTWAQGKYKTLHTFSDGKDGGGPWGGVTLDRAGNVYGTTPGGGAYEFGTVFQLSPDKKNGTWTETVVYNFCSLTNCSDGAEPFATLIFDQAGNLYGSTTVGGAYGHGTIFQLAPNKRNGSWTETVLYSFCSITSCADGSLPVGPLIFNSHGNLYGMTSGGGGSQSCSDGCGVVFKLTPQGDGSWTESVLHSFCSFKRCADGFEAQSGLTSDANGNLYGTTGSGGKKFECNLPYGCGVVFKLAPNADGTWQEHVLHQFRGTDGEFPTAQVIFDSTGSLYSTTELGGHLKRGCYGYGCGVVFKLTPNADGTWEERVLHDFTGGADGSMPYGGVVERRGQLYGTAGGGGQSRCGPNRNGCGLVFKLTPNSKGGWGETVLHDFHNHPGEDPIAGVTLDPAGNLYGTTNGDFRTTYGSVFEIIR